MDSGCKIKGKWVVKYVLWAKTGNYYVIDWHFWRRDLPVGGSRSSELFFFGLNFFKSFLSISGKL